MPATAFRLCLLLALAACSLAYAEDCAPSSLILNVLDRDGEVDRSLKAPDFSIEANGKPTAINSIAIDKNPRRIVLMMDTSGSMREDSSRNPWGITLATSLFAVDAIPTNSTAAFATFAEKLRRESPAFESREAVAGRLLRLKERPPYGSTALYRSVQQVADEFTELRFGDAIYLVTDGGSNAGSGTRAETARKLAARGIRLFIFLVQTDRYFQTDEESLGPSEMEQMAQSTGGALVRISSAQLAPSQRGTLDKLSRQIADQAVGFYRLELDSAVEKKPGQVKVRFVNRDRAKNARTITYARQITPCPH